MRLWHEREGEGKQRGDQALNVQGLGPSEVSWTTTVVLRLTSTTDEDGLTLKVSKEFFVSVESIFKFKACENLF